MGTDDGQPSAAVVEGTRQDDPEHVGAVGLGGRPEEGVDGRPVAVLPGTAGHPDPVVLDEHVVVGRGDVDPAPDDPLAVHRVGRGEPPRVASRNALIVSASSTAPDAAAPPADTLL